MNIIAARWALTTGAPPTARYVLLTLACHANRTGRAWPSLPTLAAETGLGRRAVIYALTALEEEGLIMVERSPGHPNRYLLAVDNQGGASGAPVHLTTKRGAPGAQRGAPGAPKGFRRVNTEGGAIGTTAGATTVDNGRATFLPGTGWIDER